MDVLGGETLRNKLQRNVKINSKVFSNIQQMILLLWKQGISHNDISINNIMVNTDDSVRLLDFGLATIVSNNVMYSDALESARKILKQKKSARISLENLLSVIYGKDVTL